MNKIDKFLRKLFVHERLKVTFFITKIVRNETHGMNIFKLKGSENVFRLRTGDIRIIYKKIDSSVSILDIDRRSDNTYRNY